MSSCVSARGSTSSLEVPLAMQLLDGQLVYAARDVVGFALCPQLVTLELAAAAGRLPRPTIADPLLDRLVERGHEHERRFLEELRGRGFEVVEVTPDGTVADKAERLRSAAEATRQAMADGVPVIYQATFFDGRRRGHADFLRRVDRPSLLGEWSYEVWDTKLARDATAAALLQVLFYDEQLDAIQGPGERYVHLALGGSAREVRSFRVSRYGAYYRRLRRRFEARIALPSAGNPFAAPEPVEHCQVCAWRQHCGAQRRAADHLSLIPGATAAQRKRLREAGVATRAALAALDGERLRDIAPSGSLEPYRRLQRQAAIQLEGERTGESRYELLPPERGADGNWLPKGLLALPEPSPGDLFLDIEGDPFAFDVGVDYLFGIYDPTAATSAERYRGFWAIDDRGQVTQEAERRAFEACIDALVDRFRRFQRDDGRAGMHIYHFGAYEPATLKRLASRYGTREEELDGLLRAEAFVDLYRVVRQGLLASVESYSIKQLERFYDFRRETSLEAADESIAAFERWLELGGEGVEPATVRGRIEGYNCDDCRSAAALREWLEERRRELERTHGPLPRPTPGTAVPSARVTEEVRRLEALAARLTVGLTPDASQWGPEERGRWLLAQLLFWHRREEKASWWRYFSLLELTDEERLADAYALAGLEPVNEVPSPRGGVTVTYRFPPQEHRLEVGSRPHDPATGRSAGEVLDLDDAAGRIVLRRSAKNAATPHPASLVPLDVVPTQALNDRLAALADWVAEHGLEGDGPYRAVRDLLLRRPPRLRHGGRDRKASGDPELPDAALRLVTALDESYLAIQGPPGSGKTTLAAELIVELVVRGKRVGVTANSHKVIENLLQRVEEVAGRKGRPVRIGERNAGGVRPGWVELKGRAATEKLRRGEVDVAGGTPWFWCGKGLEPVDVLFVDEAGQLSLANVVAAGMAAKNLVLVGDPQQLDQPLQGSHPPGADRSALTHVLDGRPTIPPEFGLFLERTQRLHPDLCTFTSELFYDGRLRPAPDCTRQQLDVAGLPETGLLLVPVGHEGCDVQSDEEVEVVARLVTHLLAPGASWVDRSGHRHPLRPEDLLVIAPYNAQVRALRARLPAHVRVGTVDKFQGQEAAVAIYSMTTSSKEEAPRGMEFLYSLNRLNVATSRARCLAIVVASPALLDPPCTTVRQIELANALARFVELAVELPEGYGSSPS